MQDASPSRTVVIASMRWVSSACQRVDSRVQSRLVGGWSAGRVARASPISAQGQAETLPGPHDGDPPQHVPLEPALVAGRPHRGDEPALLVEAHGSDRQARAVRDLADREQVVSVHPSTVARLDLKCT